MAMLSLSGGATRLRVSALPLPSVSPQSPLSTAANGRPSSTSFRRPRLLLTPPPRPPPLAFCYSPASETASLPMASSQTGSDRSSDGFGFEFLTMKPYSPPSWASYLRPLPYLLPPPLADTYSPLESAGFAQRY